MKKHLLIFACVLLLIPFMQACSDGGTPGRNVRETLISVDKKEINLDNITEGNTVNFEFNITNINEREIVIDYRVIINRADKDDQNVNVTVSDCKTRVKNLIKLDAAEVCTVSVSYQVEAEKNQDFQNFVKILTEKGADLISIPINYEILPKYNKTYQSTELH